MKNKVLTGILISILALSGTAAAAVVLPAVKNIAVSASVNSATDFTVGIFKSNGLDGSGNATYNWATDLFPNIAFGNLIPGDATNPNSARAGANSFLALVVCTNNSGVLYKVQLTGSSLKLNGTSATVKLSDDCWTAQGGVQTGASDGFNTIYTAGVNKVIHSASETYDVYTSTAAGATDVFRVYFGITGDPAKTKSGTATNLILPSQAAGSYSGTIKLTMYN